MKRILLTIILAATFITAAYHIEHYYSIKGIIINENIVRDITGNEWAVDHIPFQAKEWVTIHFENNNTPDNRLDDKIINISLKGEK